MAKKQEVIEAEPPHEKLGGGTHAKQSLRLWLRMLSLVMVIEKDLRRRMVDQFESTLPRFDVMSALERKRSGISMSELSHSLMVSSGNVTGVIDRLIADGMVSREFDKNDRRRITVKLTTQGLREFRRMARMHERWFDDLFASLDDDEINGLLSALGKVRASVDERLAESRNAK